MVDIAAAGKAGIPVCNIPTYGSQAVAQQVFALLLALCRRVESHAAGVSSGRWGKAPDWCYWDAPQIGLEGKVMGIVGFGAIGSRVGKIASAFGMEVVGHTFGPRFDPGFTPFSYVETIAEVFERADVVSLHCPLVAENSGFVNDELLGRMKKTAYLINTARGPLIDEDALVRALLRGTIAGAGLDVLASEPPADDNPLLGLPNCLVTPHVAWATLEARRNLMRTATENLAAWKAGNAQNVVNSRFL